MCIDRRTEYAELPARKETGGKAHDARVRNPIYYQQIDLLKEDLRLSMAVNPELAAAFEISRSILLPDTAKVETFMKGKVEMVEFIVKERSHLAEYRLLSFTASSRSKFWYVL
mgnify:CR=1 FL=1